MHTKEYIRVRNHMAVKFVTRNSLENLVSMHTIGGYIPLLERNHKDVIFVKSCLHNVYTRESMQWRKSHVCEVVKPSLPIQGWHLTGHEKIHTPHHMPWLHIFYVHTISTVHTVYVCVYSELDSCILFVYVVCLLLHTLLALLYESIIELRL